MQPALRQAPSSQCLSTMRFILAIAASLVGVVSAAHSVHTAEGRTRQRATRSVGFDL